MKLKVTLYKCSGCSLLGMYEGKIRTHCKLTCKNHRPLKYTFDHDFTDTDEHPPPRERQKTGPKPIDIYESIRGRTYAFSPTIEVETDPTLQRLEYLFETEGLLDTCIQSPIADVVPGQLVRFFGYLWGSRAPKEFQSIVMHRGKVYEIDDIYENGDVSCAEYKSIRAYFTESDFLIKFLKVITAICTIWIPQHRPDKIGYAHHIMDWIRKSDGRLDVYNVFAKDSVYEKDRKKCYIVVRRANRITDTLRNIFPSTTLKKCLK